MNCLHLQPHVSLRQFREFGTPQQWRLHVERLGRVFHDPLRLLICDRWVVTMKLLVLCMAFYDCDLVSLSYVHLLLRMRKTNYHLALILFRTSTRFDGGLRKAGMRLLTLIQIYKYDARSGSCCLRYFSRSPIRIRGAHAIVGSVQECIRVFRSPFAVRAHLSFACLPTHRQPVSVKIA